MLDLWSTVQDERVRERHAELNGKRFKWGDPPVVDIQTGRRAESGEDYQCRCVALPVFDIDELNLVFESVDDSKTGQSLYVHPTTRERIPVGPEAIKQTNILKNQKNSSSQSGGAKWTGSGRTAQEIGKSAAKVPNQGVTTMEINIPVNNEKVFTIPEKRGIINTGGDDLINIADEKRKILDGTYPSRVIQGRQNKHISGTTQFKQNQDKMRSIGSNPSILEADAQILVDNYKGTGTIYFKGSSYPRELIETNEIVGKSWVKSLNKYVETKKIEIFYSSTGTHVVPVNDYKTR
jgi:hypothetical protein